MDNFSIFGLFWHATLLVKIVILFLLAASIFSWTIIFQRAVLFKNAAAALQRFNRLLANSTDLVGLYHMLNTKHRISCAEKFFIAGMKEFAIAKKEAVTNQEAYDRLKRTLDLSEIQELTLLENQLTLLATIGSVSPYIGLFGTVWGIMHSFISLSSINEQVTIATVAPGIAEALIATAIGLFAAIPAVIAFNHYSNNLNSIINSYDELQQRLILCVKKLP